MATFLVIKGIFNGKTTGERVELDDPRTQRWVANGWLTPVGETVEVAQIVVDSAVTLKAIELVAVAKLPELLTLIDDVEVLTAALDVETRAGAMAAIEARLTELEPEEESAEDDADDSADGNSDDSAETPEDAA